jgi:hypothetical protein
MKKQQLRPEASPQPQPRSSAGVASAEPPQMAAQRRRVALMDNSARTLQLKLLAQDMSRSPVVQFGPRNYGATFKPQKNEMMKWLQDSKLIGMDLDEDSAEAGSANEKVGWHHQYPYSVLWDNATYRYMADHGANLKLGPMKNRIGDPGDDVDLAYGKAKRNSEGGPRDDISATYDPYSQQLAAELLKPNRPTDKKRLLESISMPILDKSTPNQVYEPTTIDKEVYWSEWYLSKSIRAVLVSPEAVRQAIVAYAKPSLIEATATISSTLNRLLDGMQYSYATHTPAQIDGTLGKFQNAVMVETGIPSSKLNRKGPLSALLVGGESETYADLMHALLREKKWISRGSQGEAHSVVEQYKDKMKSGNRELIWEMLQLVSLPHLELVVEEQYKKSVKRCLLKLDDGRLPDLFYKGIRELQRASGEGELDASAVASIVKQLGAVAPLEQSSYSEEELDPLVQAASFVPEIDDEHRHDIANLYAHFLAGKRGQSLLAKGLPSTALTILGDHALQRGDDAEEGKGFMFTRQGGLVMSAADLGASFKALLKGVKVSKQELDMEQMDGFALAVQRELGKLGTEEYRQEPLIRREERKNKIEEETICAHFASNYGTSGRNYMRHIAAINDPAKRKAYCNGIEDALRIPGKGYGDPSLRYPTPDAVQQASSGEAWNFTAQQEGEFRSAWYTQEFRDFLHRYLAEPDVQAMLWPHIPAA